MTTQYTPTLKLALPVTGELSGTWGDVVNDNITSMIEQAIAGLSTINTWTSNAHTLTTASGTTSESRCAMLVAATGGGAPTAAAQIICPAAAKLYVLQNNTSFAVTLKTSAGTGVAVAAGDTAFLFCDSTNVNSCVTTIVDGHITGNLTVDGNTTLGNATSDTITATARFNTDLIPSTDNARDLGSSANSWKDLYIDGTATIATLNVTTIDTTNLEVTNIKAKDGTAAIVLADVTGVATIAAAPVMTALTASKPVFTDASKALTSSGTLAYDQGGTGQTSYAAGDIVYASATNTLAKLTIGSSGQRLVVAAGLPSWATDATIGTVTSVAQSFTGGLISVAGSPITTSGTLALTVAGTSGGVPYFSSGTTWATSAALAASALVIGGGAGAAPSTTTTGTGVVTALGVNTGTAGAFVVNGGALGTPSSGTVTNLTGTASININGTVGATTPTTGAFTTLSADKGSIGTVATFKGGTKTAYIYSDNSYLALTDAAGAGGNGILINSSTPTVYQQISGSLVTEVTSTGLAVTGTLSATGRSGVTMSGQTSAVSLGQVSTDPTYGLLSFNGAFAATTLTGIWGGAGSPDMIIGVPTGGSIYSRVNNSTVTLLNSTGLAVTGTLSATGNTTIGNATGSPELLLSGGASTGGGILKLLKANVLKWMVGNQSAIAGDTSDNLLIYDFANSSIRATFTSTGLAVTGTLSSTLDATIQGVTVGLGAGAVATNTAVGASAIANASAGLASTALGYFALTSATGNYNTGVGSQTLYNTTGSDNVGVGNNALITNTSGSYNTAIGRDALQANTTASNNTAVGYVAGYSNTTGALNTFIGRYSGYLNTTASNNTMIGASSGQNNSTGGSNTAIGVDALINNTTASNNTAVGYQALYASTPPVVTAGAFVIATSYTILTVGTTNFVAIGASANTVGVVFTATGAGSGTGTASTNINALNTAVGYGSGNAITTGAKNTILGGYSGNQGGLDIRTASNYIVLSDGDGNPRQIIDTNGYLFYYTMSSGAGTNALKYSTSTGAVTYDTSSARYKDNIRDSIYGLSHVMQMRSAQFEYKDTGRSDVGLIAEELDPIIPELVGKNKDGQPDSVSYDRMVSVLVKAIQELKSEVDSLKLQLKGA